MRLVSNLDVNNNLLKNGNKNIGPVESSFLPVNKDQITIKDIQDALLNDAGEVPAGLTFEEFITALMTKVAKEITTTDSKLPQIEVTGAISGTGVGIDSVIEVGSANSSYTLINTGTKTKYIDGQAMTHKITMGKSEEETSYLDAGCQDQGGTWSGGSGSNNFSISTILFTVFPNGSEGYEESGTLSVSNLTLTESYGASQNDLNKNSDYTYKFCSSYGNPLYTKKGDAISSGKCSDTTSNSTSKTISTKFYSWVKGVAYLGPVSMIEGNQTLYAGDTFIFPENKVLTITWTTTIEDDSKPSSDMITSSIKYLKLPSAGNLSKLVESIPSDAPYKKYKVCSITSKIPGEIKNAKITIS